MKKIALLIFVIASVISISKAQEFDYITSKQALDYLKSNGVDTSYNFIMIEALENIQIPGSSINLDNGTSTMWVVITKSKDTTDNLGYIYVVYNYGGEFSAELSTDGQTEYQQIPTLPSIIENSTELAKAIAKSQQLTDFYNKYKDDIFLKILIASNNPDTDKFVWQCSYFVDDSTMGMCVWDISTLESYGCGFLVSSVNEIMKKVSKSYPIPANDNVSFEIPETGNVEIQIFDQLGAKVKQFSAIIDGKINININDLQNGIYQVRIYNGSKIYADKIIINR